MAITKLSYFLMDMIGTILNLKRPMSVKNYLKDPAK